MYLCIYVCIYVCNFKVGFEKANLAKTLIRTYPWELFLAFIVISMNIGFGLLGPIYFLHSLSTYASTPSVNVGYGIWLAFGMMLNDTMRSLLVHQYWLMVAQISSKFRTTIIGLWGNETIMSTCKSEVKKEIFEKERRMEDDHI